MIYCVKVDATATHDVLKSTMEYVAKLTSTMKSELQPQVAKENAADTLQKWLAN